MLKVKEILDSIAATSSRNEKEEILKKNKDNDLLRYVLYFVYNPYIVTGLSDKKMNKNIAFREFVSLNMDMMEYLKENNTGTDVDVYRVKSLIKRQPLELQVLYYQIATKNLKIGITAKTINKIFGKNFIPEFNVMLADKYADHEEKVKEFIITEKLDGIRAVIIKENGKVSIFSRQGQLIEGLIDIEKEIEFLPDNMVYDGELLLINEKNLNSADLYRTTVREVRKDGIKKNVEFYAFDMLPVEEFKNGKSTRGCYYRKGYLSNTLRDLGLQYVKRLDILYTGDDKSKIAELLNIAEKQGKEGLMVNTIDGRYECKRSRELLKVKTFKTADVRVLEVIEGTNKNQHKLGAIRIQFEHNGELHECNCGSGFSDEERVNYFNNPELLIGKIVEVGYFEISSNQDGGYGLRFPTWKSIVRNDKDEISMY